MSRLANQPAADTPAQIGQVHTDERRTAVYLVLADIPRGMVISYGELAALAGLGRAARWVGRTLSQLPADTCLPWHRVIGSGGRLSLAADTPAGTEQRARLRAEGVAVHGSRVDMRRYGWHPRAGKG